MGMTRSLHTLFWCCLATLLLSGCGGKTTVILLPDDSGTVGHVTVSTLSGTVEITNAGESTVVSGNRQPSAPKIVSDDAIARGFSDVLAILPEKPAHFLLYFETESTRLTKESRQSMPEIIRAVASRESQDVGIVGHTDTAGDEGYNMRLSLRRADAVKKLLVEEGVDPSHITITSHGEENPLIKTGDNVHELRNRRVEVVVR